MIPKVWSLGVALVLATAFAAPGCHKDKSDSPDPAKSDGSAPSVGSGSAPQGSGLQREAQDAALAEIARHWVKGPDGWTTARTIGTSFAPDNFLRQYRDIAVEGVNPFDLSESDRLNGVEWTGEVAFKSSPAREAGDPGLAFEGLAGLSVNRQRGRWTQWVDYQADTVRLQKVKGKWQVSQDNNLLRGKLPTAADFTQAGVK
ncbi:MAG: hypothetical protein JWN24_2553 [Phycisphaerales bacterium]|nr:hypothetical protein [Phycisphaerales bacterium]